MYVVTNVTITKWFLSFMYLYALHVELLTYFFHEVMKPKFRQRCAIYWDTYLWTASFFKTGEMATPTKSQNLIILGLGVLASTQWSQPSRFRHWHPSFGDNGYLHLRALHKTNYFYCIAILISCQPRKIFITTWYLCGI